MSTGSDINSLRILVTGGAGFLGSHLTGALLAQGHLVTVLDNFQTGSRANLQALSARYGSALTVLEGDVRALPAGLEVDRIYNLACPASPPHYQSDPVGTTMTCVQGALQVLELATRCNARVLQASTSEVYGDPEIHPQREGYWGNVNCTGRRSCYDEGKRCAESLFFDFHRTRGTRIKVVRIFNTYGPQMSPEDGRVISNFIMQALADEDITIFGDGSQTRSFCYCADLIRGLMAMMESELDFIGPVNLGNPGEFTIAELAHLVQEMTGSNSGIIHLPIPENDPKLRRPDISLAREKLGWQPEIPLRQGLAATIEYFRSLSAGTANP